MRELLLGGSSRRLGRAPHFFRGGADSVPAIRRLGPAIRINFAFPLGTVAVSASIHPAFGPVHGFDP
jgi:hypothetical protein